MSEVHRFGFTRLDKEGDGARQPRCNIIFVHGLGGHPLLTWAEDAHGTTTAGSPSSLRASSKASARRKKPVAASTPSSASPDASDREPFWPRDLLADDLPEARIWTYGYGEDAIDARLDVIDMDGVSQHGTDLINLLERSVLNKDPVLFVAHGLGGIIVKDAFCKSDTLQQQTMATVFLGTPHRASSATRWTQTASNLAAVALQHSTNKAKVKLQIDGQKLDDVHERFVKIATGRGIEVHSFHEAREMSGVKGIIGKVVSDCSSTLKMPGGEVQKIDADHLQMAKCAGKDDPRYVAISGILRRFVQQAIENNSVDSQSSASLSACASELLSNPSKKRAVATHDSVTAPLVWPRSRTDFGVAIVCALTIEADAVLALFDRHWDEMGPPFDKAPGDPNSYSTGSMGRHNVVLVHMAGMGKSHAAAAATSLRFSFPNINLALLVGVCGVVPTSPNGEDEIFLGDVILSDGVIQYDLGRRLPQQFSRKDTLLDSLGRPNLEIRGLLSKMKGIRARKMLADKTAGYLLDLRAHRELGAMYPGAQYDQLFRTKYCHISDGASCSECGCSRGEIVRRRSEACVPQAAVHFGLIASGDTVMKHGEERDRIAEQEKVIAFEMEGAGLWEAIPCVVVKSACDYADSHKTKEWQRYSAATAAACAKAFLDHWVPTITESGRPSSTQAATPTVATAMTRGIKESRFNIPFQRNKRFVGREETLETLRARLFDDDDGPLCLAVVGLGGVGKTQLALQMAYRIREEEPDWSVFWLPALSMAGFDQACAGMARDLELAGPGQEDPKELVRRYLGSAESGSWVLIVDNADDTHTVLGTADSTGVNGHLPRSERGRILFTTRSADVALAVADDNVVELEEMNEVEARDFLHKLLPTDKLGDDISAAALLRELTYLPLAISQAAAYINRNRISISKYLELLRTPETEKKAVGLLTREFHDPQRYRETRHAVATTWVVSFEQIQRDDEPAAQLLSFMSQIEPRAIPRSILPIPGSEEELVHAMGTLMGYAFLQEREDGRTFDMHSLVHLALRAWVAGQETAEHVRRSAVAHLRNVFHTDEWEQRETWRPYLPHVLMAIRVDSEGVDEGVDWRADECFLGYWAGNCLRVEGHIKEAVEQLEHLVAVREQTLAEDHPARLGSQKALGYAYMLDGQVPKARKLLEYVVTIEARILAEDNHDRLASQHLLAEAYIPDGQIQEAIKLLECIVAVDIRTLKEDNPSRLATQHLLAQAYHDNGQFQEAIQLIEYVVAVQRTLAEDHPDRLASQHELARMYSVGGQVEEGILLLEHVVAVQANCLSLSHPSRVKSEKLLAEMQLGAVD